MPTRFGRPRNAQDQTWFGLPSDTVGDQPPTTPLPVRSLGHTQTLTLITGGYSKRDLFTQDPYHDQLLNRVPIRQRLALGVGSLSHGHTLTEPDIGLGINLGVLSLTHAEHTLTEPALDFGVDLKVRSFGHPHSLTQPRTKIDVNTTSLSHTHALTQPQIVKVYLEVEGMRHTHTVTEPPVVENLASLQAPSPLVLRVDAPGVPIQRDDPRILDWLETAVCVDDDGVTPLAYTNDWDTGGPPLEEDTVTPVTFNATSTFGRELEDTSNVTVLPPATGEAADEYKLGIGVGVGVGI